MKLTDLFIADMERERDKTRKAVEAVPEDRGDWKPHDKAMALGRLAGLVAMMPSWITMMIERDELDVAPATPHQSQFSQTPKTRAELARTVDDGFAGARKALEGTTDEHLLKPWRLKARGNVVQEAPRHVMMRDALMHLAHHRGQLTTYVRVAAARCRRSMGRRRTTRRSKRLGGQRTAGRYGRAPPGTCDAIPEAWLRINSSSSLWGSSAW